MKNMKKLLQKAMVFTLTAAMLVGTPMTASAAGLVDLYKIEDGWGNTTEDSDDDTRTGTVTSTATDSGSRILDVDTNAKFLGIVLSETDVELKLDGAYDSKNPVKRSLQVEFVWDGEPDKATEEALCKLLKWESNSRNVVSLNNPNKNGNLKEMELVAKAGGNAKVTVSLNDYARNIHFTTTANVYVKQYASKLSFSDELDDDAYEGSSLDLADYLVKDPSTANDEITYEVVKGNGTIKNGVLKLGKIKATKEDSKSVTIVAIGEKVKTTPAKTITIREARPATKIAIVKKGETKPVKGTYDWLVNTEDKQEFEVLLTTKDKKEFKRSSSTDKTYCTDDITWTSKKPDIVTIGEEGSSAKKVDSITLVPHKVGKAQIIAQASTGKKATLTVNVRANLTGFTITTESGTLYSGQSIKLGADQYFGSTEKNTTENINFTDAGLTWKFDDSNKEEAKKMKNVASINANTGVLTIKADIKADKKPAKIVVTATNKKAVGVKNKDGKLYAAKGAITPSNKNKVEFEFKQVNVTRIVVYNNVRVADNNILASAILNDKETGFKTVTNKTAVQIPVDRSKSYAVRADGELESGEKVSFDVENALTWASSNEKTAIATKNANKTGTVTGIKKGSANIKVSSACKMKNGKYKAITATVKTQVTAPTKSLKLSTKNSAIAGTRKRQVITIKATLDKGSTTKAKDIKWDAIKKSGKETKPLTVSNGKVTLPKDDYKVGDTVTVTATIASAGIRSSMTFTVVEPSYKVEFKKAANDNDKESKIIKKASDDPFDLYAKIQITDKNGAWVAPADADASAANVTYTVNKKGIVQLVGNKVIPIKKGNVTITATTTDGKKTTVKVQITD